MKIAIPCHIAQITPEEEERLQELFRRFGNARRRAYNLRRKGYTQREIEKQLQAEHDINSRYAKDAFHSIRDLPPRWTSGGLKNQRLREKDRISKEEYSARRNSFIYSRGDKSKKGNLNTRLDLKGMEIRIAVPPHEGEKKRWIYPKVFIPKKYLRKYASLLAGSQPYTVQVKRKDKGKGYSLRIVVEVQEEELELLKQRVMTLDVNAGHVDFSIAEPHRVLTTGKVNLHEMQHASTNKTDNLLHEAVNKIIKIARHYKAKIVLGNLNTAKYRGHGARKIKGIPHHKLYHVLSYKFGEVQKRSEAYTSKVAEKLKNRFGLDVHKVSAAMFALKVLDYESFSSLKDALLWGVRADEGAGSLSAGRTTGSGLTAPCQAYAGGDATLSGLAGDEAFNGGGYSAIPGSWGDSSFLRSMRNNLPCLQVKIC